MPDCVCVWWFVGVVVGCEDGEDVRLCFGDSEDGGCVVDSDDWGRGAILGIELMEPVALDGSDEDFACVSDDEVFEVWCSWDGADG